MWNPACEGFRGLVGGPRRLLEARHRRHYWEYPVRRRRCPGRPSSPRGYTRALGADLAGEYHGPIEGLARCSRNSLLWKRLGPSEDVGGTPSGRRGWRGEVGARLQRRLGFGWPDQPDRWSSGRRSSHRYTGWQPRTMAESRCWKAKFWTLVTG